MLFTTVLFSQLRRFPSGAALRSPLQIAQAGNGNFATQARLSMEELTRDIAENCDQSYFSPDDSIKTRMLSEEGSVPKDGTREN